MVFTCLITLLGIFGAPVINASDQMVLLFGFFIL